MLRLGAQVVAAAIVAIVAYVLWFNLTNNLRAAGLPTNFQFLSQPLGVDIPGSDLSPGATIWRGLLVGIKNTLALVVVGIPLLTIIGVIVGVARLSTNWLVAKAAGFYVEILRNIPPLLIIFFVFYAVILQFPVLQESINLGDFLIVNNRYLAVVGFTAQPDFGPFLLIMAGAFLVAAGVWWWRTRRSERTGVHHHRFLWSLAVFSAISMIGFLALGGPIGLSRPVLDGRALEGDMSGSPPISRCCSPSSSTRRHTWLRSSGEASSPCPKARPRRRMRLPSLHSNVFVTLSCPRRCESQSHPSSANT